MEGDVDMATEALLLIVMLKYNHPMKTMKMMMMMMMMMASEDMDGLLTMQAPFEEDNIVRIGSPQHSLLVTALIVQVRSHISVMQLKPYDIDSLLSLKQFYHRPDSHSGYHYHRYH